MTSQSREKCIIKVSGRTVRTPSPGSIQLEHKTKDYEFLQTRSHAVIVYSTVPADRIYKMISQKELRRLFERLSTPRPAPKTALKSAWQSKQQQQRQQDTSESASSSTRKTGAEREEQGTPTFHPELPCVRKLKRSTESPVEKEPEFNVDLRIEAIAQDVILEDEERMRQTQEVKKN